MKIGLYDVDSKIPNLALMQIAAYHADDEVEFYYPLFADSYDRIYASTIFKDSDHSYLDPDRMIIGGTGWDLSTKLPDEIASLTPDYTIYGYPHSIGFLMRGCRFKCKPCVVPEKEGKAYSANTVNDIWTNRDSDFLILLDNDFFGNPDWSERIEEIKKYDLQICFTQGINIRTLKPEQAAAIASVRFSNLHQTNKQIYFAWDDVRHEKLIHKGIATAVDAGIKPSQMAFYVLIGFNSTPEEDMHRVQVLRDYGCDPYVMPYAKTDSYQRRFARWVNHKAIFKSVAWEDYNQ